MNLSEAMGKAERGYKIRRTGWSPDSFVVLQPGYPDGIPINETTAKSTGIPVGTVCVFDPYFLAYNGRSKTLGPWVPTTRDHLVHDWHAVPVGKDFPANAM